MYRLLKPSLSLLKIGWQGPKGIWTRLWLHDGSKAAEPTFLCVQEEVGEKQHRVFRKLLDLFLFLSYTTH